MTFLCKCIGFTVLLSMAAAGRAEEDKERNWRGPVFGYCDSKYLYASNDNAYSTGQSRIYRQPLVVAPENERKLTDVFSIDMVRDERRMFRWRIADGIYFGSSSGIQEWTQYTKRIPLIDFDLYDDGNPIPYEKRGEQRYRRYEYDRDLSNCHEWFLDPLHSLYGKICSTTPHRFSEFIHPDGSIEYSRVKPEARDVSRDELPIGKDQVRLFILQKRRIEVWQGTFVYPKEPKPGEDIVDWTASWSKKPIETIRAKFDGDFHVTARGDDYYFITDLGSIYVSHKPAKGERTMEALWDDNRDPVAYVITDLTNGKMFAFDMWPSTACPYFEIGLKREFPEIEQKIVESSKSPYPLKQVRNCVDTLLKYGQIKPPKAEPKEKK